MLAFRIAKHLDVIKHILPCSIARGVRPPPDAFPFQQVKEALGDCIIMTIPAPAHAGIRIILFGLISADGRQIFFDLILILAHYGLLFIF